MMQCTSIIPPYQLPISQVEQESFDVAIGRQKRELKDEEKLVHKLCKKFAALCDDTLGKTECLTIESVEEGEKLKFTKSSQMNDIK